MNFLQPMLLVALPLISLPIIIHLINQRRFQTIRWGAMMFLLAAQRMSRGYSRLRQWLIMLFRMLAIAGLIFAISRPLSSGWLSSKLGGKADTTLILLDRSASMQQLGAGSADSKLKTGLNQLVRTLKLLGSTRWILIESTQKKPIEISSPEALTSLPSTGTTSSAADLPAMLEAAKNYIDQNKAGRTEIWICSDLRANDWNAESGRWKGLRDSFQSLPQGVQFHLLAYPATGNGNIRVRVTDVHRQAGDHADLLVSVNLTRSGEATGSVMVPVQFEVDGARSVVNVEMTAKEYVLKDHRIPLAAHQERGWGTVSIPGDVNPNDNIFYFAFDTPPVRQSVIVAEDERQAKALQLAASVAPEPRIKTLAEIVSPERLPTVEWEKIGSVLWQGNLPEGEIAASLQSFVDKGGDVVFFPPKNPSSMLFSGVHWGGWNDSKNALPVENWRGDEDLLAHSQSGTALPVGQLQIRRTCKLAGETTPLATLSGGIPLLARRPTNRGGIYFCSTTTDPGDSSLASNGVVLYVMVQRALAAGAESLRKTWNISAGESLKSKETEVWQRVTGAEDALPTEYPFHAGIYSAGDKTWVVNRNLEEDLAGVLENGTLEKLFSGLNFTRVDDAAGNLQSLVQEIWRVFMGTMMVSLVVEAGLCLPKAPVKSDREKSQKGRAA